MQPPLIGFEVSTRRDGQKKDTILNIEVSKDFVVSLVDEDMAVAMNQSSADYPSCVDEFKETGLTPQRADFVKAPLVAEAPVNYECKLTQILEFGEHPRISDFVIGEVVMVHFREGLYINGDVDSSKLRTIGRLGMDLYCRTTDRFTMKREFNL